MSTFTFKLIDTSQTNGNLSSAVLDVKMYAVKRHFYVHDKFMQTCQNGPLDKFMQFYIICVLAFYAL